MCHHTWLSVGHPQIKMLSYLIWEVFALQYPTAKLFCPSGLDNAWTFLYRLVYLKPQYVLWRDVAKVNIILTTHKYVGHLSAKVVSGDAQE